MKVASGRSAVDLTKLYVSTSRKGPKGERWNGGDDIEPDQLRGNN